MYLRWIFLFSLFVFSSFSHLAAGDLEAFKQGEAIEPSLPHVSEEFDLEIPLIINKQPSLEISDLYPGVVKLVLEDGRNGTGFFISPDRLATAGHVVSEGPLYFIDAATGEPVFTEVLAIDEKTDLALLQAVNYESEHFYPIGSLEDEKKNDFLRRVAYELEGIYAYEAKRGDSVTIPGFPHDSFNIIQGTITDRRGFVPFFAITYKTDRYIYTFGGMSGAPVFSTDKGLIGVAISALGTDHTHKKIGFTPIGMLRDLVRKAEGGEIFSPKERKEIMQSIFFAMKHKNFREYGKIKELFW